MSQSNLIGKEILGYRVQEVLGSGAFATVYKVEKVNAAGSYVRALKHINIREEHEIGESHGLKNEFESSKPLENALEGIVKEIQILNELSEAEAPHIVKYYENEIKEDSTTRSYDVYILMEYLTSLKERIATESYTVKDVINLGLDILEGIRACHRRGIIHRDIKDDNIFYSEKGGYKLGDFGVSKLVQKFEEAQGVKGTLNYLAPEIIKNNGTYTQSVDLYALGIVLYRLLNYNRNPFLPAYPLPFTEKEEEEAYRRRIAGEVPGLPAFGGEAIGNVILKALAPLEERYKIADEFYADLEKTLHAIPQEILRSKVSFENYLHIEQKTEREANKFGVTLKDPLLSEDSSPDASKTNEASENITPSVVNRKLFETIDENYGKKKYTDDQTERIIDLSKEEKEPLITPPFYQKYLTKKYACIASGGLACLILASYFIFTGRPKPVVEDYIKAIATADFGKAYQYLDVENQPTLNAASYLKYVEAARANKNNNIYKISQQEIKSVDLVQGEEKSGILPLEATIITKKQNGEETHKLTMYVEKKKTGPFGIFTGYRIAGTGVYAIPKINYATGTDTLNIDGVSISNSKEKFNVDKPVFYGMHNIECKSKFYDEFKEKAYFDSSNGAIRLQTKSFKLNAAAEEALGEASKEFLMKFFPAAIADTGYKNCRVVSGEKTVEDMYKRLNTTLKKVGIASINITDGKVLNKYVGESGNLECQYSYSGQYQKNSEPERKCNGTVRFEFVQENGELVISKVNSYNIHLLK